tara:strand:- start:7241 stop:7747 length:507 start_codon:yes stop_codon:yes gene_type:complete
MFFKSIPNILYKANDKSFVTKDIFRRVGLDIDVNSKLAVEAYYVKDGETPDIISSNIYNSSKYHWVILIVNNIVNVNKEWPKNQYLLSEYVELKYGTGNSSVDHHYRLVSDRTIKVDYDSAKILDGTIEAVSNLDHEIELNEDKRQIFVLKPEFLSEFISSYKDLMVD